MSHVRRSTVLAGALASLALAHAQRAPAADPLRIASAPIDASAEAYYATDMGFFAQAGIDAQLSALSNGAAIASAVASNSVDVGFSNLISVAAAYKRNVPLTLLAPASLYLASDPTSVLMVPSNSPARTARDLDGKTFGASGLRTITEYAPRLWLDKNGGDSSTVKFVEMTFPQIVEALGASRIDAAIVAEPFIAEAKHVARIFANAYDAVGKRYLIGVWFTSAGWAQAHPDLARRFQTVLARTAQWADGHTRESGEILQKYGKLDPEVARTMLRVVYAPRFERAEMQPVIDLAARYGAIPASFDPQEMVVRA